MMSLRRPVLIAAVVVAFVLGLTARVSTASRIEAQPAAGGSYVEGVVGHPAYLNPVLASTNPADDDVASLVFSGLTRLNRAGQVVPDLAQRWTVSPDGTTYTFVIRPDAHWPDGRAVDSTDVAYTVSTIQDRHFPGDPAIAEVWRSVRVVTPDLHTVQFSLAQSFAPFLEYTTIGLLPAHILQGVTGQALLRAPFNARPIGTGPFAVESASLEQVMLRPNPSYIGTHPLLDRLQLKFYSDFSRALAALHRGDVQGLAGVPPADSSKVAEQGQITVLHQPEYSELNLIILNDQDPLFADSAVRQAISHAIDRNRLIQVAENGAGVAAAGPIPPASWAFSAMPNAYTYDPSTARSLLDRSGWKLGPDGVRIKAGKPFKIVLLTNNRPERLRSATEISRELRAVGIQADVQADTWSSIIQNFLATGHFQAVLTEQWSPTADPDPYGFWDSSQIKNGLNVARWSNRTADTLLEKARGLNDEQQRLAEYKSFQTLFAIEQPGIVLYYPDYLYAVPTTLKGIQPGLLLRPSNRFASVTRWYVHTRDVIAPTPSGQR